MKHCRCHSKMDLSLHLKSSHNSFSLFSFQLILFTTIQFLEGNPLDIIFIMVKMTSFPTWRHSEIHPLKSKSKIFLNLKITFVNLQNRDANELECCAQHRLCRTAFAIVRFHLETTILSGISNDRMGQVLKNH